MEKVIEKNNIKSTPPIEAASEKKNSSMSVQKDNSKTLSGLWGDIVKHSESSFFDKALNFLLHPFILLGALLATIYFVTKGKQENSDSKELRQQNITLTDELKKLKKKNKKLKAKLEALSGDGDGVTVHHSSIQYPADSSVQLSSIGKVSPTIYLD
jgi:cell division protein FtsB